MATSNKPVSLTRHSSRLRERRILSLVMMLVSLISAVTFWPALQVNLLALSVVKSIASPAHLSAADFKASDLNTSPVSAEQARLLGDWAAAAGAPQRAAERYEQALALAPDDIVTKFHLAQLYLKDGRREQANNLFRQIHAESFYLQIAVHEYQTGDLAGAEKDLKIAVWIAPQDGNLLSALSALYWLLDRKDEAEALYRQALQTQTCLAGNDGGLPSPSCLAAGARISAMQRNWKESIRSYESLITRPLLGNQDALFLTPHIVWLELARAWRDGMNDSLTAESVLQRAQNAEPRNIWLLIEIGKYYLEQLDWERAISFFQQASALDGKNPYPEIWLGDTYLRQNQPCPALVHYRWAFDRDPMNSYVRDAIEHIASENQCSTP